MSDLLEILKSNESRNSSRIIAYFVASLSASFCADTEQTLQQCRAECIELPPGEKDAQKDGKNIAPVVQLSVRHHLATQLGLYTHVQKAYSSYQNLSLITIALFTPIMEPM